MVGNPCLNVDGRPENPLQFTGVVAHAARREPPLHDHLDRSAFLVALVFLGRHHPVNLRDNWPSTIRLHLVGQQEVFAVGEHKQAESATVAHDQVQVARSELERMPPVKGLIRGLLVSLYQWSEVGEIVSLAVAGQRQGSRACNCPACEGRRREERDYRPVFILPRHAGEGRHCRTRSAASACRSRPASNPRAAPCLIAAPPAPLRSRHRAAQTAAPVHGLVRRGPAPAAAHPQALVSSQNDTTPVRTPLTPSLFFTRMRSRLWGRKFVAVV